MWHCRTQCGGCPSHQITIRCTISAPIPDRRRAPGISWAESSPSPAPPRSRVLVPLPLQPDRIELQAERLQSVKTGLALGQIPGDDLLEVAYLREAPVGEIFPYGPECLSPEITRPGRHDLDVHLEREVVRRQQVLTTCECSQGAQHLDWITWGQIAPRLLDRIRQCIDDLVRDVRQRDCRFFGPGFAPEFGLPSRRCRQAGLLELLRAKRDDIAGLVMAAILGIGGIWFAGWHERKFALRFGQPAAPSG
jgi:hypothetical protein